MKNILAVDLFCGAGGLTRGLTTAGIDVQLGVNVDSACEYPYAQTIAAVCFASLRSAVDPWGNRRGLARC